MAAALVLVVVAAALKFFLAPYLVRRQVQQVLARLWRGTVELDRAEFDLAGRARLYGLRLKDSDGRRWLRVGLAKLRISNWIAGRPVLRSIELVGPECDLHFTNGRCTLPVKRLSGGGRGRLELESFSARRATIRVMKAGRPATAATYKGIRVNVNREDESYHVLIDRRGDAPGQTCTITGTYNPRSKVANLNVVIEHSADVAETCALFGVLGWRRLAAAQGKFRATGSVRGPIDRPLECEHSLKLAAKGIRIDAPNGLIARDLDLVLEVANGKGKVSSASLAAPPGRLNLADVTLSYRLDGQKIAVEVADGVVTLAASKEPSRFWEDLLHGTELAGSVRFTGSLDYDRTRNNPLLGNMRFQSVALEVAVPTRTPLLLSGVGWHSAVLTPARLELTGLSAETCGGNVAADLDVDNWARPRRGAFRLLLKTSGVDLARLCESMGSVPAGRIAGRMELHLELAGGQVGWEGMTGRGKIHIRDGDFWSAPLVGQLFRQLRLPRSPVAISEARAVFSLVGSKLHIRHAAITNQLAGIECTGGRIDLQTRDVNLTVVASTFLTMNRLGKLLLGDIKEKLLARQVRGKWDALRPESFAPLPVGQIADSSVALLKDLARNSGKFNTTVIKGLERLFQALQPAAAAPNR